MKQSDLLLYHWKTCTKNVHGQLYHKEGSNIDFYSCIMLIRALGTAHYLIVRGGGLNSRGGVI